jgi:hypothetical protein
MCGHDLTKEGESTKLIFKVEALVGFKSGTVAIDGYLPLEHAAFV